VGRVIVSRVSGIDFSRCVKCEDYITVDHAVDRSLSGEQTLCWYVRWGVYRIHRW